LILGVGTDLIDIRRVERTLARFGVRFRDRVFTDIEQARAERHVNPAAAYAKRYAAKEACAKALGTGFRQGVYWRDIGVVNRGSGMPILELQHGAAARLAALTPHGMVAKIDLSLTDEPPYAHGMVVISAAALPDTPPTGAPSQGWLQGGLE
jgi:holo-[acyl-carrier protein] synthase